MLLAELASLADGNVAARAEDLLLRLLATAHTWCDVVDEVKDEVGMNDPVEILSDTCHVPDG